MKKKMLYIAPLTDTNSVNGGYSKVANEFKRIFSFYKKEVNCLCHKDFYELKKPIEGYDKVVMLIHPSQFIKDYKFIISILSNIEKRILHIFWETDPLPSSWDPLFESNFFNEFVVSSEFNKKLVEAKTKNKVHLIPVPLNEKDYENNRVDSFIKHQNEHEFTVLFVGQYTKRKGFEDAIISFLHALGQYENCKLILKYYPLSQIEFDAEQMIKYLINTNIKKNDLKAKIFTLREDLSKEKMYELYEESSVLLFPSRGEGFGLPIIESGMVGIPSIYTDGSSLSEFNFLENYPVACIKDTAVCMTHYGYECNSLYDVPIISDLVFNLKHAYDLWRNDIDIYYKTFTKNKDLLINKFGTEVSKDIFREFIYYESK